MSVITFYEKTGCAGNALQKALLIASGHVVKARDLRHTHWSNMALLDFLAGMPVARVRGTASLWAIAEFREGEAQPEPDGQRAERSR